MVGLGPHLLLCLIIYYYAIFVEKKSSEYIIINISIFVLRQDKIVKVKDSTKF